MAKPLKFVRIKQNPFLRPKRLSLSRADYGPGAEKSWCPPVFTMFFNRPRRRNFFHQAQLAPYRSRRFQNPFFRSRAPRAKWPFIITGVILGLAIALSSFFFTAPIFKITSVRVEGVETINPKDIRALAEKYLASRALLIFNHGNRFLFNQEDLKTILGEKMSFSYLQIIREGQGLAIVVKERISSFLWQNGEDSYLLDEAGIIIRPASGEELETILHPAALQGPTVDGSPMPEPRPVLIFNDLAAQPVKIGESKFSAEEIKNLHVFFETLKESGIYLENFELNREVGSWFKAKTSDGYVILFDPNAEIQKQIDNLLLVLRDQIKDPSKLEYIDVRFGDHVYYK